MKTILIKKDSKSMYSAENKIEKEEKPKFQRIKKKVSLVDSKKVLVMVLSIHRTYQKMKIPEVFTKEELKSSRKRKSPSTALKKPKNKKIRISLVKKK